MEPKTKLLKTYKTEIPAAAFIGRCYREADKKNGTFGWLWGEWFANNLFSPIERMLTGPAFAADMDAYCGMCRISPDGSYTYWIGMLVPDGTPVPEGYDSFPVPACDAVVNWVQGPEPDVYMHCCVADMAAMGYTWDTAPNGERMMTERYVCPRFTDRDEKGNVILDLLYFTNYR